MSSVKNDKGSVLVFMTLMIVLLLIMVGMGLDTGQLTYSRSMGQGAVDAAALSAVSGMPVSQNEVENRAKAFNPSVSVQTNSYVGSATNKIGNANVSYVKYDFATNSITAYNQTYGTAGVNGVRVALETATGSAIPTPAFLTPLFNLIGGSASATNNVNVSAVAVITTRPAIPIALWSNICTGSGIDVIIKMQHPDQNSDGSENSCWTTFFDCSSGAPDIKAGFEIASTCEGKAINGNLAIGSPICQNRGQVNTVLKTAEDFFDANPDRWWIVPVIAGGGNCDPTNPANITNWAKIYPKEIVRTGDPKYIRADVVCDPNLINDTANSLCFAHRLVREKTKGY